MSNEAARFAYRVAGWDEHHETSRAAKKRPAAVRVPARHDGRGYRRTLAQPNGIELYAAWVILVTVASQGPRRGLLADEAGPLSVEDIAFKTGFPVELLQQALDWFSSPEIRWLTREPWQPLSPPEPNPRDDQPPTNPCNPADGESEDENEVEPHADDEPRSSLIPVAVAAVPNPMLHSPPPARLPPSAQNRNPLKPVARSPVAIGFAPGEKVFDPLPESPEEKADKEELDRYLTQALMELLECEQLPSADEIREKYPRVASRVIAYLQDPCHLQRDQAEHVIS